MLNYCISPHWHTHLNFSSSFFLVPPKFPVEILCFLHLSICLTILLVLKDFHFLCYVEAVFSFSDSSLLFSLSKSMSNRCVRPLGSSHKSYLPQAFVYTSLLGMDLSGKIQQWVHSYMWAAGEITNHSGAVWQSGVIWFCLGFLTTWKDVHRPAASSPRQADTQKKKTTHSHTGDLTQPHTLTLKTKHIHFAVILLSSVAVGVDKQCELTCRPAGYRFYVRQAERVRDGTPCFNVSSNDVCVEGRCLVRAFKYAFLWEFRWLSPSPSLSSCWGWQNPEPGSLSLASGSWFKPGIQIQSVSSLFFLLPYSGPLFSVSFPLSFFLSFALSFSDFALVPTFCFSEESGQLQLRNLHKQRWNKHWLSMWNVNKIRIAILCSVPTPPPTFLLFPNPAFLPHCLTRHSHLFTFFSCQTEGCDGVLGSGSVIDKCGVCGGRDTSCRKVAGSFQNVTVPLGYHKILDIPPGATFINITERRASPNYLGKIW